MNRFVFSLCLVSFFWCSFSLLAHSANRQSPIDFQSLSQELHFVSKVEKLSPANNERWVDWYCSDEKIKGYFRKCMLVQITLVSLSLEIDGVERPIANLVVSSRKGSCYQTHSSLLIRDDLMEYFSEPKMVKRMILRLHREAAAFGLTQNRTHVIMVPNLLERRVFLSRLPKLNIDQRKSSSFFYESMMSLKSFKKSSKLFNILLASEEDDRENPSFLFKDEDGTIKQEVLLDPLQALLIEPFHCLPFSNEIGGGEDFFYYIMSLRELAAKNP